jgi:hypothetical protein
MLVGLTFIACTMSVISSLSSLAWASKRSTL